MICIVTTTSHIDAERRREVERRARQGTTSRRLTLFVKAILVYLALAIAVAILARRLGVFG